LERFFQEAREDFDSKAHSPKKSSDSPGHVTGGGSGHVKLKKVTDYKLKKIVCPKKRGRHSHRKKRDSSVKPPTHAKKSLKVKSLKARSTPQAEI